MIDLRFKVVILAAILRARRMSFCRSADLVPLPYQWPFVKRELEWLDFYA